MIKKIQHAASVLRDNLYIRAICSYKSVNDIMNPIRFEKTPDGIVTLTFDAPEQSANTMTAAFKQAFSDVIGRLEAEKDQITGVIMTSAKKTFFAGGNLKDLMAVTPEQGEEFYSRSIKAKLEHRRLEKLGKPVVAAINGTALGGGWELCLMSHARFCLDDDKILLGLPEVTLGLLPGAGGIVRMTRMLGLKAALSYLTEGKLFSPADAIKAGLLNGLAQTQSQLIEQARAWIRSVPAPSQPWDQPGFQIPGGPATSAELMELAETTRASLFKKNRGCLPAPATILQAAIDGMSVEIDEALRIETRAMTLLVTHPVSKNMINTFFFQANEIKAGKSRPADVPRATFTRVGVLGAGLMGAGIAYSNAMRGLTTVLKDVSIAAADKGKLHTEKLLDKQVQRGQLSTEKRNAVLERITPTDRVQDLQGCELIIEAVFEKRELKALVTREAEPFLTPNGIMASNTSTLPISGLASASAHPENFIGLHFFSPVDKMPLVEIIKGQKTSDETLARAFDYVMQIGKTPIVVNDSRGFFTSRVFRTFRNEGIRMLADGIDPELIENASLDAGMPVGPLAVADEVSMALSMSVTEQTRIDLEAEGKRYVPDAADAVVAKMVTELKRPGRAGGGGFYEYPAEGKKYLWPELAHHFLSGSVEIPYQDMKDRILFVQAIETVRCMQEGVLQSSRDANIGSIMGIGFPRWTGGAIQFINQYGLEKFTARARQLQELYGERFAPPAMLLQKTITGQVFE